MGKFEGLAEFVQEQAQETEQKQAVKSAPKYERRSKRINISTTPTIYARLRELEAQAQIKSVNDLTNQLYIEFLQKNGYL